MPRYFQNIYTRKIYKYEFGTTPFDAENWREVTGYEYDLAMAQARSAYEIKKFNAEVSEND